jgi:hypothetical protein
MNNHPKGMNKNFFKKGLTNARASAIMSPESKRGEQKNVLYQLY